MSILPLQSLCGVSAMLFANCRISSSSYLNAIWPIIQIAKSSYFDLPYQAWLSPHLSTCYHICFTNPRWSWLLAPWPQARSSRVFATNKTPLHQHRHRSSLPDCAPAFITFIQATHFYTGRYPVYSVEQCTLDWYKLSVSTCYPWPDFAVPAMVTHCSATAWPFSHGQCISTQSADNSCISVF